MVTISVIVFTIITVSAVCAAPGPTPTQAIAKTCSRTLFPDHCVNSLLKFPDSFTASEQDLVHVYFNMTLKHFNDALYKTTSVSSIRMDPLARSVYGICIELLEDSVEAVSRALSIVIASRKDEARGNSDDVVKWLSGASTNYHTCVEGFEGVSGEVKDRVLEELKDLSELVSNCYSIFAASRGDDLAGTPVQNRENQNMDEEKFPEWLGKKERKLLDTPVSELQTDIIVSKDGRKGTVKTITEAIQMAPENSPTRIIIYVMAGRYEENNLKVGSNKKNLMFIGDGMDKTVISGGKSVSDNLGTMDTATFAAYGDDFMVRDITFVNWAGPAKHQAVALFVSADHAVIYKCSIIGYQDTLYVYKYSQFYRECDIYGTVDFIFGDAIAVFQNCTIYARKPMLQQKNTITAQGRENPWDKTGISIHACRILPTPDLAATNGSFETYLGRPWKLYSRVVFMLSYMDDHIHPKGWLEWNRTFALDTLYYGEYMNYGPGATVGQRIKWPGYRVITSETEASNFTVEQFIQGSSWLPSTGVPFLGGLHV